MPIDSFAARGTLSAAGISFTIFQLDALPSAARLPYSLKVLLENLLRNEVGLAMSSGGMGIQLTMSRDAFCSFN